MDDGDEAENGEPLEAEPISRTPRDSRPCGRPPPASVDTADLISGDLRTTISDEPAFLV